MKDIVEVLDHGFVRLVDHMGSDLTVVNAARVSFGKRKEALDEQDLKLITYLANNKHWSPFRHVQLSFHIKMPEFVARQFYRHNVGCEYTSGEARTVDSSWSEISGRYVEVGDLDFYLPEVYRTQSEDNKQGSAEDLPTDINMIVMKVVLDHIKKSKSRYQTLRELGVAKEMARMVIPLNFYTEFYWTASLQAIANFIKLREDSHAQNEIRAYANAIKEFSLQVVPHSLHALLNTGEIR